MRAAKRMPNGGVVATLNGAGCVLAVPGRHESAALTDMCTDCWVTTEPVAVADERGGRVAVYRCPKCGDRWLCWWSGVNR